MENELAKQYPWDREPDKEWFFINGYECLILRHPSLKHLCGYVSVDRNHPMHGVDHDDGKLLDIRVHGGLTYSKSQFPDEESTGKWVFGFDCAHAGDFSPYSIELDERYDIAIDHNTTDIYRDFEFVWEEINDLVNQLME